MNINAHKARTALDGKATNGYTVRIEGTSPGGVRGTLIDTSGKKRRDLPFVIEAEEAQFLVPAVVTDIEKEFLDYIKQEALGPAQGAPQLYLRYPPRRYR